MHSWLSQPAAATSSSGRHAAASARVSGGRQPGVRAHSPSASTAVTADRYSITTCGCSGFPLVDSCRTSTAANPMQQGDTAAAASATEGRVEAADHGSSRMVTPSRLAAATTRRSVGKGSLSVRLAAAAVASGAVKLSRETMARGRLAEAYSAPMTPPVPTSPRASSIRRCVPSGWRRAAASTVSAATMPNAVRARMTSGTGTPLAAHSLTPTCIAAMAAADSAKKPSPAASESSARLGVASPGDDIEAAEAASTRRRSDGSAGRHGEGDAETDAAD
mmetsp:Transcript_44649/g.113012  ORF Transcript_44649/g.113012 Transcript_44649/m.113012 type:complete len:277 (-) Transcript_44649:288-1118(-)